MTNKEKILAEIERLMKWKPKAIPSGMRQRDVLNIRKSMLLTLKDFINSLPAEQPSEDFKEEFDNYLVHSDIRNPNFEGSFGYDDIRKTAIHFVNWQKNRDKQILSTLYDDCSLLKDSLDKVTTGNLSHHIGNIKFSITGMQVLIKQEMEDKHGKTN